MLWAFWPSGFPRGGFPCGSGGWFDLVLVRNEYVIVRILVCWLGFCRRVTALY
jgi:hypothetical protein